MRAWVRDTPFSKAPYGPKFKLPDSDGSAARYPPVAQGGGG